MKGSNTLSATYTTYVIICQVLEYDDFRPLPGFCPSLMLRVCFLFARSFMRHTVLYETRQVRRQYGCMKVAVTKRNDEVDLVEKRVCWRVLVQV